MDEDFLPRFFYCHWVMPDFDIEGLKELVEETSYAIRAVKEKINGNQVTFGSAAQ